MSLERIQQDARKVTEGNLSDDIIFTDKGGNSVTVRGFVSKHNMSIDPSNGLPVNARNAHVSVSEKSLTEKGYTVRNIKGRVDLKGHKVSFVLDNKTHTFLIDSVMPSDTFQVLVCTLGDYCYE